MQMNYNPYQQNSYNPTYPVYPTPSFPQRIQPEPQGIIGKMVQSADMITANDVPMSTISFFPRQDLEEIYVKSWDANGTIKTIVYKPCLDGLNSNAVNSSDELEKLKIDLSENVREVFSERFDAIEAKLNELVSNTDKLKPKTTTSRAKKEAES